MKFWVVLLTLLFNSARFGTILLHLAAMAGMYFLFQKCGRKGWHALVPFWNQYVLGEIAGRAHEGRVLMFAEAGISLLGSLSIVFTNDLILIASLLVSFLALIYEVRIFSGLTEVFARSKRWVIAWLIADYIVAPLWGLWKVFQPENLQDTREIIENYFSAGNVAVLEEGLTVNLKERSVRNFFQKKTLLRDIHLTVNPGRMVLLLGGSGAGKSTLVNAINGYEKADAEVVLNGRNVYKDYDQMKYEVGFVPQQDLMRGNDTVLRTLMDASALRLPMDFSIADRRKRVDEVMEIFGLLPVRSSLVEKLSGGQRKRLSIAMEFISNPSLFILDEPDSGLDGVMARELMEQLRSIADQGKIVIVITHTPDRVADLFDEVIVLAKDAGRTGRLAYHGPVDGAREFFGIERMEHIVKLINRTEEGGDGRADEFVRKFTEVCNG